jgi:hypothetical protein
VRARGRWSIGSLKPGGLRVLQIIVREERDGGRLSTEIKLLSGRMQEREKHVREEGR